jgi:hypothetical protein
MATPPRANRRRKSLSPSPRELVFAPVGRRRAEFEKRQSETADRRREKPQRRRDGGARSPISPAARGSPHTTSEFGDSHAGEDEQRRARTDLRAAESEFERQIRRGCGVSTVRDKSLAQRQFEHYEQQVASVAAAESGMREWEVDDLLARAAAGVAEEEDGVSEVPNAAGFGALGDSVAVEDDEAAAALAFLEEEQLQAEAAYADAQTGEEELWDSAAAERVACPACLRMTLQRHPESAQLSLCARCGLVVPGLPADVGQRLMAAVARHDASACELVGQFAIDAVADPESGCSTVWFQCECGTEQIL